jgi:endonuclease I
MLSVILTVSPLVMMGYVKPAISDETGRNNPDGIYITEIVDSKLHRVEFVELYNAGAQDVSLSGWVLEETRGNTRSKGAVTTIQLTGILPANGFVIVARNSSKSRFESYFHVLLASNVTYINSQDGLIINKSHQKFVLKKDSRIVDNHDGVFLRNQKRIAVRTDFSQFNKSAFDMLRVSTRNATPGKLTEEQTTLFEKLRVSNRNATPDKSTEEQTAILNLARDDTSEKLEPHVKSAEAESHVKSVAVVDKVNEANEAVFAYYTSAYGKTGQQLKAALNKIITTGHKPLTYSAVWNALKGTDEDPNNPDNVILLYKQTSQSKSSNGRHRGNWNREHVWAKSHGRFGTRKGPGTDLHHIRPTDVTANRVRGRLDFDNGGHVVRAAPLCKKDGDSWEPPDAVKGDIARMLFYMDARYEGGKRKIDLELLDFTGTSGPEFGKLSTLKQWHQDDPVSDFEITRNDKIQELQGNRNPFIDYPEWVEKIW